MSDKEAQDDFLAHLSSIYDQTNDHLREQDTKRDQVIAFYVVLLSFVITSGSLLAKTANKSIIYLGLIGVGAICVRTVADLRSWHRQYLDTISVINWIKAHQAEYPTVLEMKNTIHFRVKANPDGKPYKATKITTENGIYYGVVVLTALPMLFVAKSNHCSTLLTWEIVGVYLVTAMVIAAMYLGKTVTNGLSYSTWNLLFDYSVKDLTESVYDNKYMTVNVNAQDVLHVTQKTGGVVALVHDRDDNVLLLKHARQGHYLWEVARGFREDSDPDGFKSAEREVNEELGISLEDFDAKYHSLGTIMPDSNLLTTDILIVEVAVDQLPKAEEIVLQVIEGVDDFEIKSLGEVQRMIGASEIVDGYTIAAVAKYVVRDTDSHD